MQNPKIGTVSIFTIFPPKPQYGAAESQIAQINSQSKHTMLRRKNRKILHKNEIFKANEHAP
jgi:hypothetical protein